MWMLLTSIGDQAADGSLKESFRSPFLIDWRRKAPVTLDTSHEL